jgi:uncharacterized protein YgfB (UPF0149 family)
MHNSPEYSDVCLALEKSAWAGSATEAHGMLCGMICADGVVGAATWLDTMGEGLEESDVLAYEAAESFRALAAVTCHALESGDMSFELLLLPDSEPIHDRAAHIGSWCQGFLSGLGGDSLERAADVRELLELPEISEVLGDIAEIAKASAEDADSGQDDEEQEAAYAEIVEYVRVSVQLIYETVIRSRVPEQETRH